MLGLTENREQNEIPGNENKSNKLNMPRKIEY
jgi:hypothetical protein